MLKTDLSALQEVIYQSDSRFFLNPHQLFSNVIVPRAGDHELEATCCSTWCRFCRRAGVLEVAGQVPAVEHLTVQKLYSANSLYDSYRPLEHPSPFPTTINYWLHLVGLSPAVAKCCGRAWLRILSPAAQG